LKYPDKNKSLHVASYLILWSAESDIVEFLGFKRLSAFMCT